MNQHVFDVVSLTNSLAKHFKRITVQFNFFYTIYADHFQCNMAQHLKKLAAVYQRIEDRPQ